MIAAVQTVVLVAPPLVPLGLLAVTRSPETRLPESRLQARLEDGSLTKRA